MGDGAPPPVRVEGLAAGYGGRSRGARVLRDVTFVVPEASGTAVVGPNGAGKSTLFRVLFGILRPRAGSVTIGSGPPGRARATGRIGYLPEDLPLPAGWTAGAWVRTAARARGLAGPTLTAHVVRLMEELGVAGERDSAVDTLSRGVGRRVALAFVLAGRPSVLLLDEPLASLDPQGRARVRRRLAMERSLGATLLVATHELAEVPRLADRALVLTRGRIVSAEPPDPESLEARILHGRPRCD